MKSYNNLWEKFISEENLRLAKKNALKGKSTRLSIVKKLEDSDFDSKIMKYAKNFKNAKHTPKEIYDGIQRKKRIIGKLKKYVSKYDLRKGEKYGVVKIALNGAA